MFYNDLKHYLLQANLTTLMPNLLLRYKKFKPDQPDDKATLYIKGVNLFDPTGDEASYTPWLLGELLEDRLQALGDKLA